MSEEKNTSNLIKNISGVDHPVIQKDSITPAGRQFKSVTSSVPLSDQPRIIAAARLNKNGFETMIPVSVEPTSENLTEGLNTSPYECTIQYFNRTNRSIKVTDKNNVTFTLSKPHYWSGHQQEYLVVRKIHRFQSAEVARSVLHNNQIDRQVISLANEERRQIINRIDELHRTGNLNNPRSQAQVVIDRLIPISLFNEYMAIYVSDLDIMFRQDDIDIGTPHPTSLDAVLQGELLKTFKDHRVSGLLYNIIDNESAFLPRYICLGNQIHQIPTCRDQGRQSGIYITHIDNLDMNRINVNLTFHPLDKAEELGIYATREDAQVRGNLDDSVRLRLVKSEQELLIYKQNFAEEEAKRKSAQAELEHERNKNLLQLENASKTLGHTATMKEILAKLELREEQDRIERESARRKDVYEERSYYRKDSSEALKWAPAVVTGIAAAATAVAVYNQQKLKTKTAEKTSEILLTHALKGIINRRLF